MLFKMEQAIQAISTHLKDSLAYDISIFETSFLIKSIGRRVSLHACQSTDEYLNLFKTNANEPTELIESLHIGHSEFFRNPLTFACLEQLVLPMWANRRYKGNGPEIRIWSAACAAGQEAYSMAILLDEMNDANNSQLEYRIFASDNHAGALAKAANGIYHRRSMGKTSLHRFEKYFSQDGDHYEISNRLKNRIDFSHFDLLSDAGYCPASSIFGDFDLVFCCNLLFYYNQQTQEKILEKIAKSISPNGYLVTGEVERELLIRNDYHEIVAHSAIFQKRGLVETSTQKLL